MTDPAGSTPLLSASTGLTAQQVSDMIAAAIAARPSSPQARPRDALSAATRSLQHLPKFSGDDDPTTRKENYLVWRESVNDALNLMGVLDIVKKLELQPNLVQLGLDEVHQLIEHRTHMGRVRLLHHQFQLLWQGFEQK